ncbi:hypothetical protein HYU50_01845 [Candidatus Woesearchaeota archaeon]|nr:hypothetical protein [Candidatus Woesearchaeota archaeon]
MNKTAIFALLLSLAIVYGCAASQMTFGQGVKKINGLDEKYGSSLKSPPNSTDKIAGLAAELNEFKAANENFPESLRYLVDFRIKFLEAEKLSAEGWQWGKASTTEFGFGCNKGYARITESAGLRNASANKGFEAVELLQKFIDSYPEEATSLDLTQRDVLSLKAVYFQEMEKAEKDARIIRSLCKEQANMTGV